MKNNYIIEKSVLWLFNQVVKQALSGNAMRGGEGRGNDWARLQIFCRQRFRILKLYRRRRSLVLFLVLLLWLVGGTYFTCYGHHSSRSLRLKVHNGAARLSDFRLCLAASMLQPAAETNERPAKLK